MATLNESYQNSMSSTLTALLNLPQQLSELPREKAIEVLNEMRRPIAEFLDQTVISSKQAASNEILCEEKLESIENEINQAHQDRDALEEHIKDTQAQIEGCKTQISMTSQQQGEAIQRNNALQEKIKNLQQRAKELEKWCWVPGYGQYLGIRNLVDGDMKQYDRTIEEIKHLNDEIRQDQVAIEKFISVLRELNLSVDALREHINRLIEFAEHLQNQRIECKQHVTYLSQFKLYLDTLDQKLEKVIENIEDVQEVVNYLNSKVSLNSEGIGEDEVMLLKEAMIRCSQYVENEPLQKC